MAKKARHTQRERERSTRQVEHLNADALNLCRTDDGRASAVRDEPVVRVGGMRSRVGLAPGPWPRRSGDFWYVCEGLFLSGGGRERSGER